MAALIEIEHFQPVPERSYLVFCSGGAGWRVGEWDCSTGNGRWSLALDPETELTITHVIDPAIDIVHGAEAFWWTASRQPPWPALSMNA